MARATGQVNDFVGIPIGTENVVEHAPRFCRTAND